MPAIGYNGAGLQPVPAGTMILLSFRPLSGGICVQVRGTYFRICADATLRGPDNDVTARYNKQQWLLGQRGFAEFHCNTPIYLRMTHLDGRQERQGPYQFLRASDGALFTNERCLGSYDCSARVFPVDCWREVALLSVPG